MISVRALSALIEIGYLIQHGMEYRVSACSIRMNGREEPFTDNMVTDDRGGATESVVPSDHSSIRLVRALSLIDPLLARN